MYKKKQTKIMSDAREICEMFAEETLLHERTIANIIIHKEKKRQKR